jgi:hypothetical protein
LTVLIQLQRKQLQNHLQQVLLRSQLLLLLQLFLMKIKKSSRQSSSELIKRVPLIKDTRKSKQCFMLRKKLKLLKLPKKLVNLNLWHRQKQNQLPLVQIQSQLCKHLLQIQMDL